MRSRDRARATRLRVALALSGATALLAAFGGCRQILSIEDKEYDPALDADAGADGDAASDADAEVTLSCESYCNLIQSGCIKDNAQYASVEACLGLCSTFPTGSLEDSTGNSLGCRIHVLQTSPLLETKDCLAAGPGGNGVCGDNCESFCKSMLTVCPDAYESEPDCRNVCDPLLKCPPYHVDTSAVTPDDPSIQCRLYHISAAAVGLENATPGQPTASQTKHCPHAEGVTECMPDTDAGCPSP